MALKIYYARASERSVGRVLGISKPNVYNWMSYIGLSVKNLQAKPMKTFISKGVTFVESIANISPWANHINIA